MLAVLGFIFGAVFGSFLNVVIYRVPEKKSLVTPSACGSCGKELKPWMNIPLFSYLFLRGKCGHCKSSYSSQYFFVELFSGVSGAIILSYFTPIHVAIGLFFFMLISITLTMIDWKTMLLPNAIVYPSYLVLLFFISQESIVRSAMGALALGGFYFLIWLVYPRGMGFGDVKLAPILGFILAFFGWGVLAVGSFTPYVLASLYALIFRKSRKTEIPFGPWMLIGAWVGIFFGSSIASAYLSFL